VGSTYQKSTGLAARLDNNKAPEKRPETWKFIKSTAGGLLAALPGVAVYMWLSSYLTTIGATLPRNIFFDFLASVQRGSAEYTIPALVYAFIASTFIGQLLAFIPNRKIAFRADSNVALGTFLTICLAILTIFLNGLIGPAIAAVVFRFAAWITGTATLSAGAAGGLNLLIKALSMASTVAWCYPINRFVIHRKSKNTLEEKA
jgi:putative flippase GtrA